MMRKLNTILTRFVPEQHRWKVSLFEHWDRIIGRMKDKVRIEKIEGSVLVLGVCHPSWAQELSFLSPMLKRKINKVLKEEKITAIKFRMVDLDSSRARRPAKERCIGKSQIVPKGRDVKLPAAAKKSLAGVAESGFRDALKQYYARCSSTTRWREK